MSTGQKAGRSGRHRPSSRLPVGIAVAAGVLALPVILVATTALQARGQSEDLSTAISAAKSTLSTGSFASLPGDVAAIELAAADLVDTTDTWRWDVLAHLPGMAETAFAVPVLATTVQILADAAAPLAARVDSSPSTLALIRQLPELRPDVEGLAAAAAAAAAALDGVPSSNLRFGLAEQLAAAKDATSSIASYASSAASSYDTLTGLLGFDGARTYLVMLQNPAEARGSGGLLSAFMLVTLDNGAPTIVEANSRKSLDDLRIPVPGDLDAGEKATWGDFLTKWASFNVSPDFATVASLARSGMRARGTPVDGVVSIDPALVQAILAGTGPVEHGGVSIDSNSAADFFTKGIYEDFPGFTDVSAKDELVLGLLYATVDSVLKRPLDLTALAGALPPAIADGHLLAWVPSPTERAWLNQSGIAHDLAALDPATTVVFLNNATGGKVDAYVTTDVAQETGQCTYASGDFRGWQQSTLTVTLTNNAPVDLPEYVDVRLDDPQAPKGSTRILVGVLGPTGAVDQQVTTNGEPADYTSLQSHDRPFWLSQLELNRGESGALSIVYATPSGADPSSTVEVTGPFSPATVTSTDQGSTRTCD